VKECSICGEEHDEELHGEPECILQPSNYTIPEFADAVEAEAKTLVDYEPAPMTEEELADPESADWRIDEANSAIEEGGFTVLEEDDSWIVYRAVEE